MMHSTRLASRLPLIALLLAGTALLGSCVAKQQSTTILLNEPTGAGQSIRFPLSAGFVPGNSFELERTVAPGVTHKFFSNGELPLTRNTVFADISRDDLTIESVKGNGKFFERESVPQMAERISAPGHRAIAAVNGDFWGDRSYPLNYFVAEGMIWKSYSAAVGGTGRAFFAFDEEENLYIGKDAMAIELTVPGQSIAIDEVNFPIDSTDTIIYTYPIGDEAPVPPAGWTQAVLDNPTGNWLPNEAVTLTVRTIGGDTAVSLDRNTLVLQLRGEPPHWLRQEAQVRLLAQFPGLPSTVTGMVGGGGWLVQDGEVFPQGWWDKESIGETFFTDRHPRTGVGIMPDGKTLVLCVIDGRQLGLSRGISLGDFAEYFHSLGCAQALNLDGGGSSAMVVEGELVSFPSDFGGPRSVTNGLALIRTDDVGYPESLEVLPRDVRLPTGSSIMLSVEARDADGEVTSLDGYRTTLSLDGRRAAVNPEGKLAVGAPGQVVVDARAWAPNATTPVKGRTTYDISDPETMTFDPKALLLSVGDTAEVILDTEPLSGDPFFRNIIVEDVDVPAFLSYDQQTRTLTALEKGVGLVTASLGEVEAALPVAVERYHENVFNSFDQLPSDNPKGWMSLLRAKEDATNLTLSTSVVHEGSASWKWDYAMAGGGTTKIALPLAQPIPGEPLAIGIWVYGDGQNQWLRGGMSDANGSHYYLNFSDSQAGIDWKNEWRFLRAELLDATAAGSGSAMKPPYTLKELYIVQPQEAAKRDGSIYIDGLSAIDLPEELKEWTAAHAQRQEKLRQERAEKRIR